MRICFYSLIFLLLSCTDAPDSDGKITLQSFPIDTTPPQVAEQEYVESERWEAPEDLFPHYRKGEVTDSISWKTIDKGLHLAEIPAPIRCDIADSKITVLRVDPARYAFELISAGDRDGFARTAKEWAREEGLIAAFNAGMFQMDGITNAGLLKHFDYVNNARFNSNYKTITAFNPVSDELPPFRIIDVECDDWKSLVEQYRSYTQCLRMVSCRGTNVWSQQKRYWSMVSVGVDSKGNALFCYTRSPYSVHDFNDMLLQLPLDLAGMMYLEGGPETSFYVHHNGVEVARMGSYETDFVLHDTNDQFWAIPNVIGVRVR